MLHLSISARCQGLSDWDALITFSLMRAAVLQHTNLTEFVLRNVMSVARKIIDENERLALTERDSLHVLDLLDNPPAPNDKLMAAAFAMPKQS